MWKKLRRWLNNIQARDPLQRQQAALFQILLIGLLLTVVLAIILNVILLGREALTPAGFGPNLVLLLIVTIMLWSLRRGHFTGVLGILIAAMLLGIIAEFTENGIRNNGSSLILFFIPITLAGLLIGPSALALTAGLSAAIVLGAALLEQTGAPWVGSSLPPASAELALEFILIGGLFTLILDSSGNAMRRALRDSVERESELQREIAERKRLERELQAERDFALQIINTMGQGLTVTNEDGRFVLVNPAYARFMGYEPHELIGLRPQDVTLSEDQRELEEARNARQQGRTTTYESQLRRKDGNKIHVLITGSPRLKDGKYIGSIASITDLSEIKRAEFEREKLITELSAKNAGLERFTYTVSHDLKSPLVTIKGFLGYLEQDAISGNVERLKGDSRRIANAVDKMAQLMGDLLELSRIGRFVNPPNTVPFDELVHQAIELVQGRIQQRGVTIELEPNLPLDFYIVQNTDE